MVNPSFLVTAYRLTLGEYDSVTGVPARQFTSTTVSIVIGTKGSPIMFQGGMHYARTDALGITNADLDEGDFLKDSYSTTDINYWYVSARRPVVVGNVFVAYELDLAHAPCLPFVVLSGDFGFETITPGVLEFEEGFERFTITV